MRRLIRLILQPLFKDQLYSFVQRTDVCIVFAMLGPILLCFLLVK